jgi:hypothetical protein
VYKEGVSISAVILIDFPAPLFLFMWH